jgi:hypothetical protein
MAHDGLRVGVGVMGVGIPDAVIHKIAKPALAHVLDEPPRLVAPQLVNGNLQDEPRWGLNGVTFRQRRVGGPSYVCDESQ